MPVEIRTIQQAYRFPLDPTPRQARQFLSHAGGARYAFNWGLAAKAAALDARQAQKEAGEEPTAPVPGHFDLCKLWTEFKDSATVCRRCSMPINVGDDGTPITPGDDSSSGSTGDGGSSALTGGDGKQDGQTCRDGEPHEPGRGLPWVSENFSGTYQAALRDAHQAWQNFFDSRSGKRKGRHAGRPKFKSKRNPKRSFQTHGDGLRIVDYRHVNVPKIGSVRTHEPTRKLLRRIRKGLTDCSNCQATGLVKVETKSGTKERKCGTCKGSGSAPYARIVRGTISLHTNGRWYISITVETQREVRTSPSLRQRAGGRIGLDLGVRSLLITSRGDEIANPRYLDKGLRRLRHAQQSLSRAQPDSRRREKARRRVAQLHARVGHLRLDACHKITTELVHTHAGVAVEGWDVQQTAERGSLRLERRRRRERNRRLADAALGNLRWQLQSKGAWYGCDVYVADVHAPTGRTCSACGAVRTKPLPPAEELFMCPSCGYAIDRRVNTARSVARLARESKDAAGSGSEAQNARGGDVRPGASRRAGRSSLNREARAGPRPGQTGTPAG